MNCVYSMNREEIYKKKKPLLVRRSGFIEYLFLGNIFKNELAFKKLFSGIIKVF